jgi:CSLREA domain-containing protein
MKTPASEFRPRLLKLILVTGGLLVAGHLFAGTITVTSLNDNGAGTLRNAIAAANSGDSINFSVTGVINLTSGPLTIAKNITINGPGANLLEVSRTSGVYQIFIIFNGSNGPTVSISGISITNGHASNSVQRTYSTDGGAILIDAASLTLTDCTLAGNTADIFGGAIANVEGSILTVSRCTFSNNGATGDVDGDNTFDAWGGAIYNEGTLTVSDSTFTGNSVSTDIISTDPDRAPAYGGAIYTQNSALVTRCTFSNNTAYGFQEARGGAICNNTSFGHNSALTVRNCTIVGSTASSQTFSAGGAISNLGSNNAVANVTVSNSTLSNNAAITGWSIYNEGQSGANAFVSLDNTIIASSTLGATLVNVGSGTSISSQGYNLSTDDGGGFLTAAGDQINTDPKLGPLQNNNGPTQTMALLDGSPAWDKGKNFGVAIDERGLARPYDDLTLVNASGGDGSDIGAVEMQAGPSFVVTTTADHNDGICDGTDCTLREAIIAANAKSGADAITFKSSVRGTITLQSGLGPLTVSGLVTITGPGARSLAVSGNNSIRVFTFGSGTSSVSGLNIINGRILGAANSNAAGGGVSNAAGATLAFSDCEFSGNFVQGGDSSVVNGTGGNGFGGAIDNNGTLILDRCTFSNNATKGGVGGPGSLAVDGIPSGGLGGSGDGGAVFNEIAGNLTINNSTFSGNFGTGGKGGVSQNFVGGAGGDGVAGVFDSGTTTIIGCTFNGNSGLGGVGGSSGRGAGFTGASGVGVGGLETNNTTVKSTIIAGNGGVGGANSSKDVDGPVTSGGYNLIGSADHSSGFGATGDQSGTDAAQVNAVLGPLQNNAGKTDTMALLTNSPAINTSNVAVAPARDQRNYMRAGTPDKGAFEFNGKIPNALANISARAFVQTGDNVMIGGFIVSGLGAKKVIIRAIGPSLSNFGITNPLQNPTLELHDASGVIATNDNWGDAANHQAITNSGLAPGNPQESAILTTLNPGNYTAIVSGVGSSSGVALVECFDLDPTTASKLGNISARALVLTGDSIMIGGFIVNGPDSETVIIRAIGPSLASFGITNAMQDPTLELHDVNGTLVSSNDNWEDTQQAQIQPTGLAPSNYAESALIQTLAPGNYTAIVKGKNDTTGVALVEVYGLN